MLTLAVLNPVRTETNSSPRAARTSQEGRVQGVANSLTPVSATRRQHVVAAYGKVPLAFEANQGQTDKGVQFFARGNGYSVFLTPTASVLTLHAPADADKRGQLRSAPHTPRARQGAVLRMELLGANPKATATGVAELPGKSNYFIGNDPKQWRTNVPNYSKVRFADVYRGVDLVYYGNQRQLEYDFVVAPGADPSAITLAFTGAERLKIDAEGELALQTEIGEVRWHKPVIYQEVGGVRQTVSGRYVPKGESAVGFEVASYDPHHSLVIDPTLAYSTYLGGSGDDDALGIAIDGLGNAYVTGSTQSANFPTTLTPPFNNPPFFHGILGSEDAFVTKLNPTGTGIVYSTYLGGAGTDVGNAIAVDEAGNAYVTGYTDSGNFPTTIFQLTVVPGGGDAFVTKLKYDGSVLIYSTYLGGSGQDQGLAIAVDPVSGVAFVTGTTTSINFPTTAGAFQTTFGGGPSDMFVTRMSSGGYGGAGFFYSTYLGGSSLEGSSFAGIALDSNDNVYVTGTTSSGNFPVTTGATTPSGSADAFVTKLKNDLSSLMYSTLLGGNGSDSGNAIAVDSSGNAYVTGDTSSTNFPTTMGAFQTGPGGNNDAFVAKLNPQGTALTYSSYLGGSDQESGRAIAVDASGNAYVTGGTGGNPSSNDLPITNDALQPVYGGGFGDAFVARLNTDGNGQDYVSFLGGSSSDGGTGIAVDGSGNVFVSGGTGGGFPTTTGAFQIDPAGLNDGFVVKISGMGAAPPPPPPPPPLPPPPPPPPPPSTPPPGGSTTCPGYPNPAFPGAICVNGGWIPPPPSTPPSSDGSTSCPGYPNPAFPGAVCVNGGWTWTAGGSTGGSTTPPSTPPPSTPPPGGSTTCPGYPNPAFPGAVCVNGGWTWTTGGSTGGSTPPPSTPPPGSSTTCPGYPNPAFPGAVCVNGGWTWTTGGTTSTGTTTTSGTTTTDGTCTTPDPFTAIGGGICSMGGWRPKV